MTDIAEIGNLLAVDSEILSMPISSSFPFVHGSVYQYNVSSTYHEAFQLLERPC